MSAVLVSAGPGVRGGGRRFCALVGLVLGMLLLFPAPGASAHAFLTDSTPADGAFLETAPTEIHMRFSESVVVEAMVLDLVDSSGRHHRPTAIRLASDPNADTEEPSEVVATLPVLDKDAYRLSWQTLSSDDLHRTSGVLVFGIGRQVSAAGSVEPLPRPEESMLRALIFVGLALALGGLLGVRLLRRIPGVDADQRLRMRCGRWAGRGALAGILGCAGLVVDQQLIGGVPLRSILLGWFGLHVLLRIAGFAVLGIAASSLGGRLLAPRTRAALIVAGAAGVGVDTALMGHSGAGLRVSTTRVLADAMHLISGATWAGTLFVAVLLALPATRRAGGTAVQQMLRAFGSPAITSFAVLLVTGVYLASDAVGSVDALLLTFYGRALLLKLLIVAAICVLGVVNHRRLRRRPATIPPARTVRAEAIAAAAVLMLAAVLTSSQPAMEPEFMAAPGAAALPIQDGLAGDLQETISLRPNQPGRNVLLLSIFDTRRPSPAPIRGVQVTIVDPAGTAQPPLNAQSIGDGQWSVTTDIGWTERFSIQVTVKRPGLQDVDATYSWVLAAPTGSTRIAVVSNAPLSAPLKMMAALLILLVIGVALTVAIRRRTSTARNGWPPAHMNEPGPSVEPIAEKVH